MEQTLNLLSQLVTDSYKEKTLEELSTEYQLNESPVVFATAFTKVYYICSSIASHYYNLDNSDLSSAACLTLHNCMLHYIPFSAKFTTYFGDCLRNSFKNEYRKFIRVNRGFGFSFDSDFTENSDGTIVANNDSFIPQNLSTVQLMDNVETTCAIHNDKRLTDMEVKVCETVINCNANTVDTSNLLSISRQYLYRLRKSIAGKLSTDFGY